METNKKIMYLIIGLLIAVALASIFYFLGTDREALPDQQTTSSTDTTHQARYMDIETYIKMNISEISSIKESLGGKFFVTKIETHSGTGAVEYEDGHNAYIADFTYTVDEAGKPSINSFIIRN